MMKHILIIDRERLLINDFMRLLDGLRCCVKTAETGLEAIRMITKEHFDMVIIDLYTSELDGKMWPSMPTLKGKMRFPLLSDYQVDLI